MIHLPRTIGQLLVLSLASIATYSGAFAQTASRSLPQHPASAQSSMPTASHGGRAELLPEQPIAENEDPVNQKVAAETVDGVVLSVTIDGTSVTLNAANLARVPRRMAVADRATGGDTVKATALANGQVIATTVVPDNVLNASEGEGLVRTARREITLVLAADRPIDTVMVEAPATAASASLDLRSAYSNICEADPNSIWCPQRARK